MRKSYVKGGLEFASPIGRGKAEEALLDNAQKLDPTTDSALWNLNVAMLYLVDGLARIQDDVNILHNKIQPILKQISDQ